MPFGQSGCAMTELRVWAALLTWAVISAALLLLGLAVIDLFSLSIQVVGCGAHLDGGRQGILAGLEGM